MASLKGIQAAISSILKQLSTAQKGFGELKDIIKSSKQHQLLRNELEDLELLIKAVQSATLQESLASPNDKMQNLVTSFDASFNKFMQGSQASAISILGMPSIEVNNFSITIQTFKRQITTQFPDNTLYHKYPGVPKWTKNLGVLMSLLMGELVEQEDMEAIKEEWEEEGKVPSSHSTQTQCILLLKSAQLKEILNWLTTINFYERQDANFETWHKGTGYWFLSLPEFKSWLSNSEKVLWCEGPPGAGKTVLSSLVIKHIKDSFQNSKVGLAYIYINHKELATQSPTALFASLCKQLLLNKPLPLMLQDLWQYHSHRETQPTLDNVLQLLEIVLLEYPRIYLVIDALDEYFNTTNEYRAVFIQHIVKIIKQFPIHLMITTRPNNMSQSRFSNLQLLPITAENSDITLYIENRFNKSDNLVQLLENRPQLKTDIQLAVVQDVGGIFLLAKLRMDYLGDQPTVASLQKALKTLPSSLVAAYEVTMARINVQAEGFQKLAKKTLMWISNALRPLSVAELCQILAVEPGDTSLDLDKVPHIETILAACAGLVTIDRELSTVRVVHYTAQDWLESQFPYGHKEIALTSFQYLEFPEFDSLRELNREKYPFAVYAQYCIEHTRMTKSEMELISQVEQFARKAWWWKQLWRSLNWSEQIFFWSNQLWPEAKEDFQTLILAAAGNLQSVSQHLLTEGQFDTKHYKCALSLAAYAGHSEIVKVLLNLDVVNAGWGMHSASQGEQTEIVKMMLDAGADMNIVGGEYGTALQAATHFGFEPIVKMLLNAGADTNIVSSKYDTALQSATRQGFEPIVKMLIHAGADVNIVSGEYGTALQAAAYWESQPIVKMLLDSGANMNIVGGKYGPVLQAAAYEGSEGIVKMLLDAGPDINIIGGKYGTALQTAVYRESEPIVKMLLDAGADVNIIGGEYGTALQAAVYRDAERIVKMLIHAGADVNIVGGEYGPALQDAAYEGSEGIVKMLLDAGADINMISGKYGTALQASAYGKSELIIRMLLDAGTDMNIVHGKYGTALQAAAFVGSQGNVKMLLDAGADANSIGGKYGTALQAAVYRESEPIVKMLLDAGADVNIIGGEYGTALQAAAYIESELIAKMLLDVGADVNMIARWDSGAASAPLEGRNYISC
ncbi:ANK-REP-region domain-containing protein [Favolaschia claudopus]|uniref:ANK-REP-region domain-containing protein n=1 Tax=Favolaschia claudopus TaxID=2862362 RepID=A0AAW0DHD7_9AGAR